MLDGGAGIKRCHSCGDGGMVQDCGTFVVMVVVVIMVGWYKMVVEFC